MSGAPTLSAADVRDRLDQVFVAGDPKHRSFLVALHGTGEVTEVSTRAAGEFQVLPVRSELELRKLVPDLEGERHIAFLVPWSGSLPLDIGCMFAAGGRILPLGRALRIRRLFGAAELDPLVLDSELAKFLLDKPGRSSFPFSGGRLTLDSLWGVWFSSELGLGEPSGPSLEELLAWAAVREGGARFAEQTAGAAAFRAELLAWLKRRLGPAAPLIWSAWESGRGPRALEFALVFDALLANPDPDSGELRMWRSLKLRELGLSTDAESGPIAQALGGAALAALRHVEARTPKQGPGLLDAADRCADVESIRASLIWSRCLPSAWWSRLDQLGAELMAGAKAPSVATLDRAVRAFRQLEGHHFFKSDANRPVLERAEMACRLLGWLVKRPDKQIPAPGASVYGEVERIARWYATEGGFVDWARRHGRGGEQRAFGRGINAVVDAVDAVRTELDLTFARALPHWLSADRPSTQVLPIERALDHLAVNFLTERDDRRLLVVLMDGMAWAQASELLLSLPAWGPVAWSARAGKLGDTLGIVPVLAHLPTVTEVSRAAFFSSKRIPAGKIEATDRDVDRFAKNGSVRKLMAPGDLPRLLLRAEGHTLGGAASSEAMHLVRDGRQRIVALVVNAIDSSLKADPQTRYAWTVDVIQPLRDLLEAALETGRVVLLASDHGHVPADRLVSVTRPPEAAARYRPWKDPTEPIADYEVAIPKELAWAPTGSHGVIVLADDAHRYGGSTNAGEHGGATLAEVVAPFILIGPEHPVVDAAATPDPSLHVAPYRAPSWWYPDVQQVAATQPKRSVTPLPRKTKESARQVAQQTDQLPLPEFLPAAPHPLRTALEASELFRARAIEPGRRQQLLVAVGVLGARNAGAAPLPAFAQAIGSLPARTPGLISTLSQLLNIDGFDLLRYDPATQHVSLDVEKLKQVYGLTDA